MYSYVVSFVIRYAFQIRTWQNYINDFINIAALLFNILKTLKSWRTISFFRKQIRECDQIFQTCFNFRPLKTERSVLLTKKKPISFREYRSIGLFSILKSKTRKIINEYWNPQRNSCFYEIHICWLGRRDRAAQFSRELLRPIWNEHSVGRCEKKRPNARRWARKQPFASDIQVQPPFVKAPEISWFIGK